MSTYSGELNFLTSENGAKVINESSHMEGCFSENILNSDKKVKFYS